MNRTWFSFSHAKYVHCMEIYRWIAPKQIPNCKFMAKWRKIDNLLSKQIKIEHFVSEKKNKQTSCYISDYNAYYYHTSILFLIRQHAYWQRAHSSSAKHCQNVKRNWNKLHDPMHFEWSWMSAQSWKAASPPREYKLLESEISFWSLALNVHRIFSNEWNFQSFRCLNELNKACCKNRVQLTESVYFSGIVKKTHETLAEFSDEMYSFQTITTEAHSFQTQQQVQHTHTHCGRI